MIKAGFVHITPGSIGKVEPVVGVVVSPCLQMCYLVTWDGVPGTKSTPHDTVSTKLRDQLSHNDIQGRYYEVASARDRPAYYSYRGIPPPSHISRVRNLT